MVNPTRVKQSFEDFNKNSNVEMKEQKKETVNDTIPDFGFVSKQENIKPKVVENKVVIKKNPSEGIYYLYHFCLFMIGGIYNLTCVNF